MILVALVIGLVAGVALPISFEHIIALGMFVTMFTTTLNPIYAVAFLGLGIAAFIKNNTVNTVKDIAKQNNAKSDNDYANVYKKVVDNYVEFFQLLIASAVLCHLMSFLIGVHTLLMPLSIFIIFLKIIHNIFINSNTSSIVRNTIGISILATLAIVTVTSTSGNANVFSYFLGTITLPGLFIKNKSESSEPANKKLSVPSAFLYGASSNAFIAPILLNQTILMGSAKDALGTIINNDITVLLDPFRVSISIAVIIFAGLYFRLFLYKHSIKVINNLKTNKRQKRGISLIISIISIAAAISKLSLPVVLLMTIGGLLANILIKDKTALRSAAVPALLLAGITVG